jgi:predicted MPP superfamily phosphohydrolase
VSICGLEIEFSRARAQSDRITVRENAVTSRHLPAAFDGFTFLHISDLHVDISEAALRHLISFVGDLDYDICVLTGDYRGKTFGPSQRATDGVAELR